MRRKIVLAFLAFLILLICTFSIASYSSRMSLEWAGTDLTNHDLDTSLASIQWTRNYEVGVFDCSNMSALLAEILQKQGFQVRIASAFRHAWLLVKTLEGVQQVEATGLYRADYYIGTPLSVASPRMAGIMNFPFASEFRYSTDQYMACNPGEEQFTTLEVESCNEWFRFIDLDYGNVTIKGEMICK